VPPFKNVKIKICNTIIYNSYSLYLYGFETCSLATKGLAVSENRALRRIFGATRDEVTGEWRNLLNEELHNLNSLSNIIRIIKPTRMK
jgi:hypothetical protein